MFLRHSFSSYRAYLVALLGAGLGLFAHGQLDEPLRLFLLPVIFIVAVLASAALGGWKPGLLCTLLSIVGWHLIYGKPERVGSLDLKYLMPLMTYLVVGVLLSALTESLQRASRRIADRHQRLKQEIAERRIAERRSRERAERLRVTLDCIGDAVITTDVEGYVTGMNPVAQSLTGWSESEAIGRPVTDVFRTVDEKTDALLDDPCHRVLQTGIPVERTNQIALIARGGKKIPIDESAAPIQEARGKVLGVVLVFRDASQQRAATAGLQQLASIVEHSEDTIIGMTIEGIITSWNAAAERLHGFTANEAIGQHITMMVPPDRHEEMEQIITQLTAGRRIAQLDTVRLRKDGTLVHVSLQISPICDNSGRVHGASQIARDITERKTTEETFAVLDETSDALAVLSDREHALQLAVNAVVPFFADWCVTRTRDSEGKLRAAVAHHRDPDKKRLLQEMLVRYPIDEDTPNISMRALRSGRTQLFEQVPETMLASVARDEVHLGLIHRLNPQSVISVPLVIRDKTIGVISFAVSESGRRYAQRHVRFAEDFARRVAIAIDNAELLESLQAADRQKDEFLAMLAHELRNPLGAVSYANSLILQADAAARDELVQLIERQVCNLSRLIDGLLDVSRISRDKVTLCKEPCDAAAVVRRVARALRPKLDEKRHVLQMDLASCPLPLVADTTRIEQVVTNVLVNAIKYTPDGGHIALSAHAQDEHVVIEVRDSGIGIAPEMLPHVFDLFAQAEQGLDRSQGGLGIGLTISRKLAEMHGGTLTAASEGLGHGSQFTITLPLSAPVTPEPQAQPLGLALAGSKLRVLVVDDNRDTVRVLAMLLARMGHNVDVAYDGPSALECTERFRPHAILLDLGLPGMSGFEVAETLRARGFTRETIIATSGYGRAEDQRRCYESGFDRHFTKPVDQQALLEMLNAIPSMPTKPVPT